MAFVGRLNTKQRNVVMLLMWKLWRLARLLGSNEIESKQYAFSVTYVGIYLTDHASIQALSNRQRISSKTAEPLFANGYSDTLQTSLLKFRFFSYN